MEAPTIGEHPQPDLSFKVSIYLPPSIVLHGTESTFCLSAPHSVCQRQDGSHLGHFSFPSSLVRPVVWGPESHLQPRGWSARGYQSSISSPGLPDYHPVSTCGYQHLPVLNCSVASTVLSSEVKSPFFLNPETHHLVVLAFWASKRASMRSPRGGCPCVWPGLAITA